MNLKLRERLLSATRDLFVRKGIKNLTMDEVAKELGMSKKTIYQMIESKDEFVQEVIERYIADEKKQLDVFATTALNPVDEIVHLYSHILTQNREMNPTVLIDMQKYYPKSWETLSEYRNVDMYKRVFDNLEKGKQEGYYVTNFDSDIVTKLYIGVLQVLANQELFPYQQYQFVNLLKEYLNYHLRAIASEKGLTAWQQHELMNTIS